VDCSDICLKEDFSTENSNGSEVTHSKVEEEPLNEEDLDMENGEEREDNISCSGGNETEICQGCDSNPTCENSKETKEKDSLSSKVFWEGCLSYGGAKEFYLEGFKEYTACEEFFGFCDLI